MVNNGKSPAIMDDSWIHGMYPLVRLLEMAIEIVDLPLKYFVISQSGPAGVVFFVARPGTI